MRRAAGARGGPPARGALVLVRAGGAGGGTVLPSVTVTQLPSALVVATL